MAKYKYCGCCKQKLNISEFAKNKSKKDGLQERCTPCRKEHHQTVKHLRKKPTPEQKRSSIIRSYGLTIEQFDLMLKKQRNKCAICKTGEWGRPSPSIDHCHKTGKVRGLLCNNCNRAIGLLKDNLGILENAKKYIKRSH